MPQFKDPKNPALNTLNKAKKRVVKNEKIQYSRLQPDQIPADDTFGEVASGKAPSRGARASGMAEIMSSLDTLTSEVVSTVSFYTIAGIRAVDAMVGDFGATGIQKPRDAVADLSPNSSAMVTLIKRGAGVLASANYDLTNKLSSVEVDSIISDVKGVAKSVRELARLARRVARFQDQDLPNAGRVAFNELWNGILRLTERWEPSLRKFIEDVDRAIGRAKSGVSATLTGSGLVRPVNYHAQNVFGGALKSLTGDGELWTMGYVGRQPLVPLSQSHAPRNTMDLVNLPRRFL